MCRQRLRLSREAAALASLTLGRMAGHGKAQNGTAATFSGPAASVIGPILPPYQQTLSSTSCGTQAICTMTFSAATGATLISQVTCFIYSSVASIYSVVLAYGSNDITLVPNLTFSTNGMATYMVNQPTLLFLSSGQAPEVAVYNDGGSVSYLSCSIFGYRMSELPAPAETKPPSGQPLPGAALLPPPIR